MNCSIPTEYDARVSELRNTLRNRGYPECVMPILPYDAAKRKRYLNKYRLRSAVHRPTMLKIAVPYSEQLRELSLKPRAEKLISRLRAELGGDFLDGARVFIANTVQYSLFRTSYKMNFPTSDDISYTI